MPGPPGRRAAPSLLADAKGKEAVILDTPPELFLSGLAHGRGKQGAMWPVPSCSPQSGNTVTRVACGTREQGLKADKPVALYGTPREVAEVARLLRQQGIKQLFELQGMERGAPGHLARWKQLVHPLWLADLQAGKPVIAAPRGVEGVRGGLGIPKAYLLSHIPGAGYIDTNRLEGEPLWNKVSDGRSRRCCWRTASVMTPPSSSMARNTMAAARAAHLMMYAGSRMCDCWMAGWRPGSCSICAPRPGWPTSSPRPRSLAWPSPPVEYYTTLTRPRPCSSSRTAPWSAMRTWDEFVGNTSGYSYIKPRGHSRGQMGSWRGGCQQHERLPTTRTAP